MPSFNRVVLVGHLTRDPELRYTPNGAAVCDASIAVNSSWKDKSGEKREEVSYFDLVIWARGAEVFSEHMRKGRAVLVEGALRQERWQTPDGSNRSKVKVHVQNFQFLGDRGAGSGSVEESGEL